MEPDTHCLLYLSRNSFIRNLPFEKFLEKNNNQIELQNYICYTTGIANGKKIIHAFRFLYESINSKIKSYYIQWWNTAAFPVINEQSTFQSVQFWVHSGMTLRKNFFLCEDRLSLFRSTFIYDLKSGFYHRLSTLNHFIVIPPISNFRHQIFTAPGKFYYHQRLPKVITAVPKNPLREEIKKQLQKIISRKNTSIYIRKSFPQLYQEIHNFIN